MTQNATLQPVPNPSTGRLRHHRGYYDLELAYEELERRHKSAMRDLGKLRKQLGRQRYLEVEADDVIAVLEFWQATLNPERPSPQSLITGRWCRSGCVTRTPVPTSRCSTCCG